MIDRRRHRHLDVPHGSAPNWALMLLASARSWSWCSQVRSSRSGASPVAGRETAAAGGRSAYRRHVRWSPLWSALRIDPARGAVAPKKRRSHERTCPASSSTAPALVVILVLGALIAAGAWLLQDRDAWPRAKPSARRCARSSRARTRTRRCVARVIWDNYLETPGERVAMERGLLGNDLRRGAAQRAGRAGAEAGILGQERRGEEGPGGAALHGRRPLITISTSGDFQRKWQANRIAAAEPRADRLRGRRKGRRRRACLSRFRGADPAAATPGDRRRRRHAERCLRTAARASAVSKLEESRRPFLPGRAGTQPEYGMRFAKIDDPAPRHVRHRFPLAHHHSGSPADVGAGEGFGARRPGAGHAPADEFEILRVLGTGGFGIVYLARDHVLQRDVAIKEYMPATLARRGEGATVVLRGSTDGSAETFAKGLRIVPQRSPAARQLRPSGAGQGASLLAEQRHRLHGDAVLPGPHAEGRAPGDARGAGRSLAEGADRAAARRARAAARARRLPPRHRARQHPRAARRPAGAARLRLRAPRRRRRLAVVHRPPQAAVRAARAVRRRRQRRPGAVDRPVLARRDAAFRRHRPRADRLGGARGARHAAGPFVVAAAGAFARPARHHRLDPRPRARRSAAGRRDGATCAPRRDRAAATPADADRGRRPRRRGGARRAREYGGEARGHAGRWRAGRDRARDRGVHWGAALSIAFAALVGLGWGPSTPPEASSAATPESVDPVVTERRVFPERLADAMPPIVVVPAVAEASRSETVESSAAAVRPISAPAPVAVAPTSRRVPRRRARQNGRCRPPPATSRAPAAATVPAC